MPRTTVRPKSTGHPDDKWGWAGQLALSIKNIPTGAGDTINVQGVYTDGATRYNIQNLASGRCYRDLWRHQHAGAYQSIGFGVCCLTPCSRPDGSQQLIQTWGMRGAFTHNWNPDWNTSDLRCLRRCPL